MIKLFTKKTARSDKWRQAIDGLPTAVMLCDLPDFKVTYANPASIEALRKLEHLLPIKADEIIGQSIDVFHKVPSHQRKLLSDPSNLPHKATIQIGDEYLDLNVTALFENGKYVGPTLSWSIVTDRIRHERHVAQLMQMMDKMPVNVMMADKDTMEITYINQTSVDTLTPLQHLLPIPANKLLGQSIDVFHKNPSHQRRLLADPSNLPHTAKIKLGDEILKLNISRVDDDKGNYIAPMLTWTVETAATRVADATTAASNTVSSAVEQLEGNARAILASSQSAEERSASVASACEEVMASIAEITRQITETATMTAATHAESDKAIVAVNELDQAVGTIGEVMSLISAIASQTNLLALNATIEAARAGEAGKGFAVVASEVKQLATQTASATDRIAKEIAQVQQRTRQVVEANEIITKQISEVSERTSAVASAVEEQQAAMDEVTTNVGEVADIIRDNATKAGDVASAADMLKGASNDLKHQIQKFMAG